jgi:catalase (peroxidase I)
MCLILGVMIVKYVSSGFEGPWTFSPTTMTNAYYTLLVDEKWQWRKWGGPKQYEDAKTKVRHRKHKTPLSISDEPFLTAQT